MTEKWRSLPTPRRRVPDEHEIAAVARLTKMRGELEAEVAVVVTDAYQGKGLGTELVRRLIQVARDEKLERIVARILTENEAMHALAQRLNFRFERSSELDSLTAVLDVQCVPSSCETGLTMQREAIPSDFL